MSSSSRNRTSARVGCLFCGRTGPPSSINDHLRKYVSPPHASKKLKGAIYHHHHIIHAFASKSKPNAQFLKTVSQDRLIVLQAFADAITQPIHSDTDADAWKQRDYWMRDYEQWEAHVKTVHRAYMDNDRDKTAMAEQVALIVAACIEADMKAQNDHVDSPDESTDHEDEDEEDADRHVLSQTAVVPNINSRQAKSAITRMAMQGGATQKGQFRKVQSGRMNMANEASKTQTPPQVLDISSDDEDLYAPGPAKTVDHCDNDAMQPLLTLKVRAITNQLFTIPLLHPISYEAALEKVWRLGPKQLHELDMPHKFVGDGEDPRWAGAWPEWRWDEVMLAARERHLTVELRIVIE